MAGGGVEGLVPRDLRPRRRIGPASRAVASLPSARARIIRPPRSSPAMRAEIPGHEALNATARHTRPSRTDREEAVERLG